MLAFREEDKSLFFGREEFVAQLVNAVQKHRLVPVIGDSGSGKSSVVLAGLIPKLREERNWLIESFRPQNQPFYELASALVRVCYPELKEKERTDERKKKVTKLFDDLINGNRKLWQEVTDILTENVRERLLLVIDQFEELYALEPKKQKQFIDALLEAINSNPRLTVVLTIRYEFLGYIINNSDFKKKALDQSKPQYLGVMNRDEMRSVIELIDRSTNKKIVELEDGLTDTILDDVQQEPGNLVLLEFALSQLWEESRGKILTHKAYRKIGGVRKALANHAEEIYQKLDEEEKKQLKQVFVQLVHLGE